MALAASSESPVLFSGEFDKICSRMQRHFGPPAPAAACLSLSFPSDRSPKRRPRLGLSLSLPPSCLSSSSSSSWRNKVEVAILRRKTAASRGYCWGRHLRTFDARPKRIRQGPKRLARTRGLLSKVGLWALRSEIEGPEDRRPMRLPGRSLRASVESVFGPELKTLPSGDVINGC